jgi:5-methylthioadenosine/S-adenosylhomocysteine deaminase
MTVDLLLRNADHVVIGDGTALEHVDVAIDAGRIVAIGTDLDVQAREVVDLRGRLLMPGLINLHTHLPMTLLRGVAEEVDLQGFLERVWAEEARVMDAEGSYIGARLGALESLLGGTTTALDMYLHPEATHRGCVEVGLRHVIGPVFFSFPGPDGLSWPERMDLAQRWPQVLADIGGPYVPFALMPHAAFTVNRENLGELAAFARENGCLIHTHASENTKENDDTIAFSGARPVEVLDETGVLALAPVLAHAVRLSASDQALVASRGASISHNPGSNLKLASGAADLVGYRGQGITVGLGTDGCSSSNDLDMFAVMRLAANLARLVREDPAAISAREIVQAATLDGARALGMADRIGSIEVGKEADIVALRLDAPHLTPLREPHTAIVFAAGRSDVESVWVAGARVVAEGHSTLVSHDTVIEAARERVARD